MNVEPARSPQPVPPGHLDRLVPVLLFAALKRTGSTIWSVTQFRFSNVDVADRASKAAMGKTPYRIDRDQTIPEHRGGVFAGSPGDVPPHRGVICSRQSRMARSGPTSAS